MDEYTFIYRYQWRLCWFYNIGQLVGRYVWSRLSDSLIFQDGLPANSGVVELDANFRTFLHIKMDKNWTTLHAGVDLRRVTLLLTRPQPTRRKSQEEEIK